MSTAHNITESGLVVEGQGKVNNLVINSHTSGTIKIYDGIEAGAAAVGTFTSSGALAAGSHATNTLTSIGASVEGSHAKTVFTSSGVVVAGQTITIGSTIYTAVEKLESGSTAYSVLMGANAEAFLANLKLAINGTGTPGTNYGDGTVAHPSVVATTVDATTITIRGRVPGTSLNTLATTETFTNGSFPDTTLGGGTGASDAGVTTANATVTIGSTVYTVVAELSETLGADAIAYQVLKGASEATMLDNLKSAINGTGTEGTDYSTGTVAHPSVVATTNSDTEQIIRGRVPGTSLNTLATTETLANTSWADTTLGGGTGASDPGVDTETATVTIDDVEYTFVTELSEALGADAIPYQIRYVTDVATALDNMKKAINASGVAGTDYSTGTKKHPTVKATTNSDTAQVVQALQVGTAGNSIATTETLANHAWGASTLASGSGTTGKVLFDTITLSAVATTGERGIELGKVDFATGLYVEVGGTLNATLSTDSY